MTAHTTTDAKGSQMRVTDQTPTTPAVTARTELQGVVTDESHADRPTKTQPPIDHWVEWVRS